MVNVLFFLYIANFWIERLRWVLTFRKNTVLWRWWKGVLRKRCCLHTKLYSAIPKKTTVWIFEAFEISKLI